MKCVLHIERLSVQYSSDKRRLALNEISLQIAQGEAFGLVGGSGSGKSTLVWSVLGLIQARGGLILQGEIRFPMEEQPERYSPGRVALIPQDPHAAFDPLFTIRNHFEEVIQLYKGNLPQKEKEALIEKFLKVCELSFSVQDLKRYPHEFSGGEKQRFLIALALIADPYLIVADEPTSSLDVTIQAEIMRLFEKIRRQNVSFLFITHHLLLAKQFSTRIAVLHEGKMVECEQVQKLFEHPQHPYTQALIEAVCETPQR